MRIFLYFIFCCALFSCKKQGARECKLISIQSGIPVGITTYEYNQQGNIIKVTDPSLTINLTYFSDSIVAVEPNSKTTYYLGPSGLATASKFRFTISNPNEIAWDYNYTYNAEGYLIQVRSIYSQLVNGILMKDTGFLKFTIQSGNITEYWLGNSIQHTYEYSQLEAKENMAFTTHPLYRWRFLGRASKNLMSRMTHLPQGPSVFDYELDDDKNIIKRKEFRSGSPGPAISYYNYQCN